VSVVARIGCVVCAIAALGLAFLTYSEVMLAGFPDGHVTDYEKAADGPLGVFSYVEAGFGVLFLGLAVSPIKPPRRRAVGLAVCVIAFVLVALVVRVGVPWYFGTHLGLDNGIGG
jgi:peptidoglycan/LPS O-acetylase OafA/YrhL